MLAWRIARGSRGRPTARPLDGRLIMRRTRCQITTRKPRGARWRARGGRGLGGGGRIQRQRYRNALQPHPASSVSGRQDSDERPQDHERERGDELVGARDIRCPGLLSLRCHRPCFPLAPRVFRIPRTGRRPTDGGSLLTGRAPQRASSPHPTPRVRGLSGRNSRPCSFLL